MENANRIKYIWLKNNSLSKSYIAKTYPKFINYHMNNLSKFKWKKKKDKNIFCYQWIINLLLIC